MATLLTFETTHYALWAEEVAQEQGIPSELVPAPPAAAARCNLALSTLAKDLPRIQEALRVAGVPFAVFVAVEEAG